MLRDSVRTITYGNSLLGNQAFVNNKIVIDVGCGSGILSMFAAKSGAKAVIGIDNSKIIEQTRLIVDDNGYSDKITLLQGTAEQLCFTNMNGSSMLTDVLISLGYPLKPNTNTTNSTTSSNSNPVASGCDYQLWSLLSSRSMDCITQFEAFIRMVHVTLLEDRIDICSSCSSSCRCSSSSINGNDDSNHNSNPTSTSTPDDDPNPFNPNTDNSMLNRGVYIIHKLDGDSIIPLPTVNYTLKDIKKKLVIIDCNSISNCIC